MNTIILIDPFISCDYIFKRVSESNAKVVVIITNTRHKKLKQIESLGYHEIYYLQPSFSILRKFLINKINKENLNIKAILNGTDDSSILTNKLISFFLPNKSNGAVSKYRTNKYQTIEILRKAGLSNQRQVLLTKDNYSKKIPYIKDLKFPVIIKPNKYGSGKEGVLILNSEADISESLINSCHSVSNREFDSYLIQEFIEGDEYVVDSVNIDGKHDIIGIYKYIKYIGNYQEVVVTGVDQVSPFTLEYQKISNYICKVMDCFEIKNSIDHTEIILKNDGTIELIEINPRLSGCDGLLHDMALLTTGTDQYMYLLNNIGVVNTAQQEFVDKYIYTKAVLLYSHKFSDNHFNRVLVKLESSYYKLILDKSQRNSINKAYNFHDVRKVVLLADNCSKKIEHDFEILSLLDQY
ncbi:MULTISPECIES: ATP-grasp domain-containing protein [unclassified Francisella]|uniref:ATP-grasp domain-containing protein n=1 Tax=unclassified Francisella TaxID=2610885 RepID=UPI002E3720DF|nr:MULTISPECIES: ATP-grasp domain-containing protein [unclassified Francisella]MED7818912.1 ATP-grasp domain-containing protein [Francisella sp. 19S2-4]MED7829749.1 ATP-grasp domain-containing protein [Francisella sp. 19S2-10]